jgi:hypothetical protein
LYVLESFLFNNTFTDFIQVALREERDKLLAEKESWAKSSAASNALDPTLEEAKRLWEAEKAELVQTRDHAFSQAKVW